VEGAENKEIFGNRMNEDAETAKAAIAGITKGVKDTDDG
jgi:hypothetical protein